MGWAWLVKTYVVPYMIVNFWLVFITLLQHTHPGERQRKCWWDWQVANWRVGDVWLGFITLLQHPGWFTGGEDRVGG